MPWIKYHSITEWSRLDLDQPVCSSYSKQVAQDHVQMAFQYFQDEYSTVISRQTASVFSYSNKAVFWYSYRSFCVFFFPLLFVLSLDNKEKSLTPSLHLPLSCLYVLMSFHLSLLLSRQNSSTSPSPTPKERSQNHRLIKWLGLEGTLKTPLPGVPSIRPVVQSPIQPGLSQMWGP